LLQALYKGTSPQLEILEEHEGVTNKDREDILQKCIELGFTKAFAHVASICVTPNVLIRTSDDYRVLEDRTLNEQELF
jgi:hypothetical protein